MKFSLLNHSAMMVDAAYDELYRAMKTGMSENQAVGLCEQSVVRPGLGYVEAVNAISGERCNPHLTCFPIACCGRAIRCITTFCIRTWLPDLLLNRCFTIGYASHAMIDAYKRCREYLDAAISLVQAGAHDGGDCFVWPKAEEFGFPDEEAAFALQFGHGIGLAIWEKP